VAFAPELEALWIVHFRSPAFLFRLPLTKGPFGGYLFSVESKILGADVGMGRTI
jgi:hypothetical protein